MATKSIEEKVAIVSKGIRYRARKRFHEGYLNNPFAIDGECPSPTLMKGMYITYEEEMDKISQECKE